MNIYDIFNKDTLNIFTDASITTDSNMMIGCPGAICIVTNNPNNDRIISNAISVLDKTFTIESNSTNNDSEIKAIRLGINKALEYRDYFTTINLFSDSRICIQGLREWIFSWMNNIKNNQLYNSSCKPVANQQIILDIINTILSNNLNINFYTQRGHVHSQAELDYARNYFKKINNIPTEVDEEVIEKISYFNNMIDEYTREQLTQLNYRISHNPNFKNPIMYVPRLKEFKEKYKKLIGGE